MCLARIAGLCLRVTWTENNSDFKILLLSLVIFDLDIKKNNGIYSLHEQTLW